MKSARDRWFEMLAAERDRRSYPELLIDGLTPIDALLAKLDQMGERLRAEPGFVEPGPEESAQHRRAIDQFFKDFKERVPKSR
jgi:hypothetical protein